MINKARLVLKNWKETGVTSQMAWKELTGQDYAEDTARKYLNAIDCWLEYGAKDNLEGVKIETSMEKIGDVYVQVSNMLIEIANMEDKTPFDMMKLHGYDPLQWELMSCTNKAWNGTSKIQGTYTMYSSTVKVKPIQKFITTDAIKRILEEAKPPKAVKHEYTGGDYLLEIPIVDLHIGRLSWAPETGFDYDIKIAEDLFKTAVTDIIAKASLYRVDKIVFPVGNDFFNADDSEGNTTKGTQQSMDSRWQKIFVKGFDLQLWAIEQLKAVAPVDVMYIPGNHDTTTSFYLVCCIEAYYRNDPAVNVDAGPMIRKYYKYHNNMIAFGHGEESKKQIDKLMQAEAPKMWGETEHREQHLAHLHKEIVTTYPGFKQRRITTITAPCNWTVGMGYTGVEQEAQGFLWEKERGLEHILFSRARAEKLCAK